MFASILEKDVLYPGTWTLADGRRVTVSATDLSNAVRRGNEMLRKNIPAPWCWEHNYDAFPAPFSGRNDWFAKGYFGKTLGFSIAKNNLGAHVRAKVGLFDKGDQKQLERVATVSPMLVWDYVDPAGATWPGLTIGHVAATPKPIQRNQGKYSAAMSGLKTRCRTFACLGEGSKMADDVKAVKAAKTDDDAGEEIPADLDGDADTGGGAAVAAVGFDPELLDLLAQLGVNVGDGVTDLDNLKVALKALVASGVGAGGGAGGPAGPGDQAGATASDMGASPAGVGPMVMSSLPAGLQKAAAGIIEGQRHDVIKRIGVLFDSGRINGQLRAQLLNRAKSATLSLMNDGKLRTTRFMIEIDAYEKLPADATWSKRQKEGAAMSGLSPVAKPDIAKAPEEISAERQELAKSIVCRKYGYTPPVAAN